MGGVQHFLQRVRHFQVADDGASFENLDEVDHVVGCVQHQAAAHNVAQPFEVSAVRAIHLRALVTSEKTRQCFEARLGCNLEALFI